MKRKNSINTYNTIGQIISAIDLNYILAEARKENYEVSLCCGNINDKINWDRKKHYLSFNYEESVRILQHYISLHKNKIIKLNVSSDSYYPLDRNIIVHVPCCENINCIKKEYSSVVVI